MSRKLNVVRQEQETDVAIQSETKVEGSEPSTEIEVEAESETESNESTVDVGDIAQPDLQHEATMMALGEQWLITHYGNKSKAIRGLSVLGHKCGPISRALNIRFQHARNVLSKPLKRLIKEEREAAKNGVDHELDTDE